MKQLENKVAIVTGGASGIGKAIVEAFVKAGAKVVVSDIQEGQAAGCMWVIAVTEGSHTAEQLAPYLPTHIIPNINHVPALVTG